MLKRGERHTLLQNCRIHDIDIPFTKGSLADVADDEEPSSSQTSAADANTTAASAVASFDHLLFIYFLLFLQRASQVSAEALEREARLKINFRRLDNDYKDLADDSELKKVVEQLQKQIKEMQEHVSKIQAPNMRAEERCGIGIEKCLSCCLACRLRGVKTREEEASTEFEGARKRHAKAKKAFEKVLCLLRR